MRAAGRGQHADVRGPLGEYLTARALAGEDRVALSFALIERILGRPLPVSARDRRGNRGWWRGGGAPPPHAWYGWVCVGWRVEAVDLAAAMVTFIRAGGAR